jgi:hypothetical protein
MITWDSKPGGQCPVQAEGFFLGYYFYFRARYNLAVVEFSKSKEDWSDDKLSVIYVMHKTDCDYAAGFLPYWFCTLLIYGACIKFLFKRNKHKVI